jgi:O-antigen/teichoic acid export membrane protein
MGIIQKQASKSTVYIYLGIAIGFANTILFPHYLTPSEKGVLDSINSAAFLLAAVFSLGLPLTTLRLFPDFRNPEKKHYGYFSLTLLVSIIGFILGLFLIYYIFKEKIPLENQTTFYFILLTGVFFFRILFNNIDVYNRMLYNVTLGILTSNFVLKALILLGVVCYAFSLVSLNELYFMYGVALSSPGIIGLVYVLFFQKNGFDFSVFIHKFKELNLRKEFISTSAYGLMGAIGGIVVLEIDRIMLLDMTGTKEVGIYATAAYFGIMVNIPSRALKGIASVVISDSWKNNDIENIRTVYQKSTLNLQVVSGFLLIGILICSPYVYTFMKPEYAQGLKVIGFIAFAQFIDALTSVNTDILSTSKLYKYQTLFMFLMVGLVVGLNYWLIPLYGINGAAISTMSSLIFVNVCRTIFIKIKFNLNPFTIGNLKVFGIMAIVYVTAYLFNEMLSFNDLLQLALIGGIITILYWGAVFLFNVSDDISAYKNKLIEQFVR